MYCTYFNNPYFLEKIDQHIMRAQVTFNQEHNLIKQKCMQFL